MSGVFLTLFPSRSPRRSEIFLAKYFTNAVSQTSQGTCQIALGDPNQNHSIKNGNELVKSVKTSDENPMKSS